MSDIPRYIAVEGPIGVGKTSLARRLADTLGSELLLEDAEANPFLERFYRDRKRVALPTQLSFLFDRVRQLETLRQPDLFRGSRVADFMMEKDPLFARLNLDADELRLYEAVYERLETDFPVPDLVLYLQAPVDVLVRRVGGRGRSWEAGMASDYLHRLAEAYTGFFYHYDKAPLLIVNAAEIDLVGNMADYEQLLHQIRSVRSGRHYFNPAPIAL